MKARPKDRRFEVRLKRLREDIDSVDRALIQALARRFRIIGRIGELKREAGIPIVQAQRRNQLYRDRRERGGKLGLDPRFVQRVFELIQIEAIKCQKKRK
jgi:chorismate mutase